MLTDEVSQEEELQDFFNDLSEDYNKKAFICKVITELLTRTISNDSLNILLIVADKIKEQGYYFNKELYYEINNFISTSCKEMKNTYNFAIDIYFNIIKSEEKLSMFLIHCRNQFDELISIIGQE